MKSVRALKYLTILVLPLAAYFSFTGYGWMCWLPLIVAFGAIPTLELIFQPSEVNMDAVEEEVARHDRSYDVVIYLTVLYQYAALIFFLYSLSDPLLTTWDIIGRTIGMGVMCGVFGINVAHELGHRNKWYEQLMAKSLLLTSLYMHFFIEHNRGHHKNVSTDDDPASSRRNEMLYTFWVRSVVYSYISAWKLEAQRLKRKKHAVISWRNEMLWYQIIQLGAIAAVYFVFGPITTLAFLGAAVFGFLLLETVNYIEHYGLRRNKVSEHRYENVQPHHSWNSNHPVGRLLLFELSRHSDHHFQPDRPYQVLQHFEASPQMPTGYPGMMLMSTIPPLWFKVMNKRVDQEMSKVDAALQSQAA